MYATSVHLPNAPRIYLCGYGRSLIHLPAAACVWIEGLFTEVPRREILGKSYRESCIHGAGNSAITPIAPDLSLVDNTASCGAA